VNGSSERPVRHDYAPWVSVLVGVAVFTLHYGSPRGTFAVHWNLILTGIVIMFVALASTIAHGQLRRNYWSLVNVMAGAWLLASATLIPSIPAITAWQVVLGVATIVAACASLAGEIASQRRSTPPAPSTAGKH
jgi:hypothetical protein